MEVNNNYEKNSCEISAQKFSTLKKLKVLITITDTEVVKIPENQFSSLFSHFENLRKSQTDFDQFLVMVRIDLMTKSDGLKKIKSCELSSRSDKSYARVQLFMLSQYMMRMTKLEDVSKKSIENICRKHHSDCEIVNVEDLVAQHIDILVKMKRRMKQMIDVSERYAVVDMFDTANDMKDLCDEMDSSMPDKESRLCRSMLSLDAELEEVRPRTVSECLSKTIDECPGATSKKKTTFKALTEHLIVITKTFTTRR